MKCLQSIYGVIMKCLRNIYEVLTKYLWSNYELLVLIWQPSQYVELKLVKMTLKWTKMTLKQLKVGDYLKIGYWRFQATLVGSLRLRSGVDTNVLHQSTEYRSHANVNDLANVFAPTFPVTYCHELKSTPIQPIQSQ